MTCSSTLLKESFELQAFFPILYDGHYFLVVFDMHKETVDVLDNAGNDESMDSKYGTTVNNLVHH